MAPKRRGGPAEPAGRGYVKPARPEQGRPAGHPQDMPRAEEAGGGQSVGDVSFNERIGVPQQPVPDAIAAVEPAPQPESRCEPAAKAPAAATAVPALPNTAVPALPNTAVPAGIDDAVSASASLLGSVAGGFGLAAVAGGGLVMIGLGAALGAWYSVALANSYLGRR